MTPRISEESFDYHILDEVESLLNFTKDKNLY